MIGKSTKKTTTFEVGQLIRYRVGGMRLRTLGMIVEKGFMQKYEWNPETENVEPRLPREEYIDVQWLSVGDLMPKQVESRYGHKDLEFWVGADMQSERRRKNPWKKPQPGVVCRHPVGDWFEAVKEMNND